MMEAGRVIAGSARGIRLVSPGPGTRPLGDRAKQTLFAILDPDLVDARVLDLFAGSGAAGIEALSRGARYVVFVERSTAACRVIDRNLNATGLPLERAKVVQRDVTDYLTAARGAAADGPFDVVLLDPPYAEGPDEALALLAEQGSIAPGGRVVAEHDARRPPADRFGPLALADRRAFGGTGVSIYVRAPG